MRSSYRRRSSYEIDTNGLKRARSGKDDFESDARRGSLTVITDSSQEEEQSSQGNLCDQVYKQIESLRGMCRTKLSEQKKKVLGNLAIQHEEIKEKISSEIEDATQQFDSLKKVHESITQKCDESCRKLLQNAFQEIREVEQLHKNLGSSTKQSFDQEKKKVLDKFAAEINQLVDNLGQKKI